MFDKAHEHRKCCVFLLATPSYQLHPHVLLLMHTTHYNIIIIGKGHQQAHDYCYVQIDAVQDADAARGVCALESSSLD